MHICRALCLDWRDFVRSSVEGTLDYMADVRVYKNFGTSPTDVRESKKKQYLLESRPYFHKVTIC